MESKRIVNVFTVFIFLMLTQIAFGEVSRDWLVVKEGKDLEESIAHCKSLGREMVSILSEDDAKHFAAITKDVDTSGSAYGYIRIGLQSPNRDCKWSWIGSDEAFNPGNWFWQSREPNGCRGKELCAQTGRGRTRWNDSKCYYKTFFVCGNPISSGKDETSSCMPEGDCKNINDLCKFIPLPNILCEQEKVKEQCPKKCNSCPAETKVCEKKYNGYYSYGDCGETNGVTSFEECCKLTKERQLKNGRITRFSYNGNTCYFKCGGKQDNRGGSFYSSAEDISDCSC